jgi:hypothetical protein
MWQLGAISTFDGKNSLKSGSEARRCLNWSMTL